MRRVIIHYHRDDGDYDDWGVWLWPKGFGGRWVDFTEIDYFGRAAVCWVPKEHRQLGFVIRGASWEKDIDQDRYIEAREFRSNICCPDTERSCRTTLQDIFFCVLIHFYVAQLGTM